MRSGILATASRLLLPLLLVFSVFLLLRGHNAPGGGFAGGLVAAAGFVLHTFANGVPATRRMLGADPRALIGAGLLVAAGSGLPALLAGKPFLTGVWLPSPLPIVGKVGTPVLFDAGVYLLVVGIVLTILLALAEE